MMTKEEIFTIKDTAQLLTLGRKWVTERNPEAKELLEHTFQTALQNLEFTNAAFALMALANYHSLVLNDTDTAFQTLERAKEFFDEDDNSLMAHYEAGKAVAHHMIGELPQAQKFYLSAITRLESLNTLSKFDEERLATLYYNHFILFSYTEDAFVDLAHLTRAMKLYEQQNNQRGTLNCLTALANHYSNFTREYSKAIETVFKALEVAEKLGDDSLLGNCCNNAALYLTRAGEFDDALKYLELAKTYFSSNDDSRGRAAGCSLTSYPGLD